MRPIPWCSKTRRGDKVKYLVTWEVDFENMDKIIEKFMKYEAESKKFPEKYPKNVIPVYIVYDGSKAFTVWEVDDPEQIAYKVAFSMPELKGKIVPIFDAAKFIEIYMKMKK